MNGVWHSLSFQLENISPYFFSLIRQLQFSINFLFSSSSKLFFLTDHIYWILFTVSFLIFWLLISSSLIEGEGGCCILITPMALITNNTSTQFWTQIWTFIIPPLDAHWSVIHLIHGFVNLHMYELQNLNPTPPSSSSHEMVSSFTPLIKWNLLIETALVITIWHFLILPLALEGERILTTVKQQQQKWDEIRKMNSLFLSSLLRNNLREFTFVTWFREALLDR